MRVIFIIICLLSMVITVSAEPVTQTFTIAGNQETFTPLVELREGQKFIIHSINGHVSFDNDSKVRDAFGKNTQGELCKREGGMVVLQPGGSFEYAPRNEANGAFWEFAEKMLHQEFRARANGTLKVKAFDQNGRYQDNNSGFYNVTVTIFPYNSKDAEIPRPPFHQQLAFHWAPIHYQDCDKNQWIADAITQIDFDGDWNTSNNWHHLYNKAANLSGAVYFSVIDTQSHWFISYCFFHPRDWKNPWDIDTDHENDLEGMVLLVRKSQQSKYGTVDALITIAHDDFYSYVPKGSPVKENEQDIDGKLIWKKDLKAKSRFCTYQEAKGHGCLALQPDSSFGQEKDYFIYYPVLENPSVPSSRFDHNARYILVDILHPSGLWKRRFDTQVFKSFGVFNKTVGDGGDAKTPWKWDDWNDGPKLKGGEMALDPVLLFSVYFHIPGFSNKYIYNPFRGIW